MAFAQARLRRILALALDAGIPRRSLWVALWVGSVLNLINQGDAILAGGPINVLKIGLTFCVPYCVATYGAVSFRLRQEQQDAALRDAPRTPG